MTREKVTKEEIRGVIASFEKPSHRREKVSPDKHFLSASSRLDTLSKLIARDLFIAHGSAILNFFDECANTTDAKLLREPANNLYESLYKDSSLINESSAEISPESMEKLGRERSLARGIVAGLIILGTDNYLNLPDAWPEFFEQIAVIHS